jgi:NAD(P)-dependent dehydrogenase (short-subunit alcohol dehydrogenase family)
VSGRHVIITGAAGGIGHALAAGFLGAGWRVTGIDVQPAPAPFPLLTADVTDESALAGAFDAAFSPQPADAVVANAALTDFEHRTALEIDYAAWQRILRVNVDGAFLTARLAARRMRPLRAGNIIFVTSSLAFLEAARANDAPYCTSKAAVEMLMRVMALELRSEGINVNSLFPSAMIDTGFFAHWSASRRAALARPDLLNRTAAFLAGLPPGALTGVSLDQQRWDDDPAYEEQLRAGIRP